MRLLFKQQIRWKILNNIYFYIIFFKKNSTSDFQNYSMEKHNKLYS